MTSSSSSSTDRVLLPPHVTPSAYSIHLKPNFSDFTFDGEEEVKVTVATSTNAITIHANDITVAAASVVYGDKEIHASDISYSKDLETVTFTFGESLPTGSAILRAKFKGNLNDVMAGFYRSKYTVNGKEKYMATTQFEPTDARRAFPCWDEPAVKAVFSIVLTVPSDQMALSNMPIISEQDHGDGTKTVTFDQSPIMSSYLVAFIVGEFDYVETTTKEGINMRVYTSPGNKEQGQFALDCGSKTLSYYTNYFGIPYALPKLDMIAIADFSAGAMENWGLVTYRETALLMDPKTSGVSTRQRVAYVVAHELAHQWFGNLVTMEWWKELWLNEGFATFIGNQAVDDLFPEWDIWTQFASQYVAGAKQLDGLQNSHPIEVEVRTSAQVSEIFDAISYSKGSAVIWMLSCWLGQDNFRRGLQIYLNRFQYKNARTEDLWTALSEASNIDVSKFMNTYTKKIGYPVLSIEPTEDKDVFSVSQKRFIASGAQVDDDTVWWLSVNVLTSQSNTLVVDVTQKQQTIKISTQGVNWFKLNAGEAGFYRVMYHPEAITSLTTAIASLPSVDRLGIQNDAFALSKAGLLATPYALQLAKAYVDETNYTVWSDLAGSLAEIATVWEGEPNYPSYEKFVRSLLTKIGASLGWDPKPGETELTALLRAVVISRLVSFGDQDTIQEARKRFDRWSKDGKGVQPDLRFATFKAMVADGDAAGYERILHVYKTAPMHEEKLLALRALGHTPSPQLIERTLAFALDGTQVRPQDIFYVFSSTGSHVAGRQITWDFMKKNFVQLGESMGTFLLFARVIAASCQDFIGEDKALEVEAFFSDKQVPSAERTIKQSLEMIRSNTAWLNKEREGVASFLKDYA